MMSRHFRLSSELTGAIAKKLLHAKNQLSLPGSFFNQFVTDVDIYIYIYTYYIHINRVLIVRIYEPVVNPTLSFVGLEPYSVTAEIVTKYSVSGSKFWIRKLVLEVVKLILQPISFDLVTQSE